jgi:molybdopterin/thiamine biosynthesis adenylyltransferase
MEDTTEKKAWPVPPPEGYTAEEEFDRQTRIEGWNQHLVENQTCLLLGAGGLGCNVAIGLARMGVGRLIILDQDTVDTSNLSRQILFSRATVGDKKVDAAKAELERTHVCSDKTTVEAHHFDALTEWPQIVEMAKRSNVVFNMIDVSDYFDAAVQSLCMKLNIPLIQGGTFAQSLNVDYYPPPSKDTSWACLSCATPGEDEKL